MIAQVERPAVVPGRYNESVLTGQTVHVVPSLEGNWQVIDLNRRVLTFPNRASAVERAKNVAESNQPSQVVLFDEHGQLVTIARHQHPRWDTGGSGNALIEAAVKALVIGELVAAGAMLGPKLVDAVNSDLRKETGKARTSGRRKRNPHR